MTELFGAHQPAVAAPIPIGIGALRHKLNIASQSEWQRMIDSMTLLPLYELWRQPTLTDCQYEAVSHNTGPYRKTLISNSRGWSAFRGSLRFCRACIADDLHNHGVAYWHRSHQVPWVVCCHRHNTPLYLHILHKRSAGYRLPLLLPYEASHTENIGTPALPLHTLSATRLQARRLADFTHGFLCNSNGLSLSNIGAACRSRLSRFNFSVKELNEFALTKAAQRYMDFLEDVSFDPLIEHSAYWMFSGESRYEYALTDIVTLSFLFRTFEDLKSTALCFTKAEPLVRFNENKTVLYEILRTCNYEHRMSCQQIAEFLRLEPVDVWCLLMLAHISPTEAWSDDHNASMARIYSNRKSGAAIAT